MKRMAEQFKLFSLQLTYPADGPDCVEGGNRVIDKKNKAGGETRHSIPEKYAVTKQVQIINLILFSYEPIYRS